MSSNEASPLLLKPGQSPAGSRSIKVLNTLTPTTKERMHKSPRFHAAMKGTSSLSPMIGGRSPSLNARILKQPAAPQFKLDEGDFQQKESLFIIYYLCGFYFMISMLLKSTLPFMVGFYKANDLEWVFGWYNGIYYFGRVIANSTMGWQSRMFEIKQNLLVSIIIGMFGIVCFASGVYFPSFWTCTSGMLLGQCIQGFATGMMAGAIGMYIQLFHRGDVSVSAAFAIAYNVGDICGPIIALPFSFFGWGLQGLLYFIIFVPVIMFLTTASVVPSGLAPIQEDGAADTNADAPTGMNFAAKFFIMVAGGLSAFYTSYEFNIPVLYDGLGYDSSMISIFLDLMAVSALCGSYFANYLPNRPQFLNELFLVTLVGGYAVSVYRSTASYIFTMIAVCIIGEFQGIVNSTVVLQFLTIQEYGWYRNMNEGGRVLLQPLFATCLQHIPKLFFLVIAAMHLVVFVFLWQTKALQSVDDENNRINQESLDEKEV